MTNKGDEALALWKEWLELPINAGIDAAVAYDQFGINHCFFCNKNNPIWNGHADNCIYIRAKTLVNGPQFQGGLIPRIDEEDGA